MQLTHAEYHLPFAKGKPLLANKHNKSLSLLHPLLILVIKMSTVKPLALTVTKTKLSHNLKRLTT